VLNNAVGNGISGFMGGFMGLLMYLKTKKALWHRHTLCWYRTNTEQIIYL